MKACSPEQEKEALACLASGMTRASTCRALGIAQATVGRMLRRNPEVQAMFRKHRGHASPISPETPDEQVIADFTQLFWQRVTVRSTKECWTWNGGLNHGYGKTKLQDRVADLLGFTTPWTYAHRVAYRLHHGWIDNDLTIDHTCHTRSCCNPAHMRQCSLSENSRRKWYHVGLTERPSDLPNAKAADSRTSDGPISPLPDTDKHAPSDEGTSIPRRSA